MKRYIFFLAYTMFLDCGDMQKSVDEKCAKSFRRELELRAAFYRYTKKAQRDSSLVYLLNKNDHDEIYPDNNKKK